jgi:hypothetical protein
MYKHISHDDYIFQCFDKVITRLCVQCINIYKVMMIIFFSALIRLLQDCVSSETCTVKFQELIMKVKSSIKKGWCVFVIILYLNNVSSSSKHNHLVFV